MRKPTFCICENKDADQLRGEFPLFLHKIICCECVLESPRRGDSNSLEKVDGGTPGICMRLLLENNHFSLLSTIQTHQDAATEHGTSKNSSFDWYELLENNGSGASDSESEKSMDQKHRADLDPRPRAEKKQLPRVKTRTTKKSGSSEKSSEKHVKTHLSLSATSVTNLSKHELSAPQISLLERGLKFIPSRHEVDKVKLLADLSEWERRMRLA